MGPTASGKSALVLELARHMPPPAVEVVSVDAMQVYRGMDIGTAKPSPAEQEDVPHHLIDVAEPHEEFSVARFQRLARAAIAGVEARGHRALLVGGTGLYLRSVIDEMDLPGQWPDVRQDLEKEPDSGLLYRRLVELDPVGAERMTPSNRRRIVRALEVTLGSGRPFSSFGAGLASHPPTRFRLAGVWLPRQVLSGRIADRVQAMFKDGLVEEVKTLAARAGGLSRTARQALGYREVLAYLDHSCSLEETMDEVARRTRAFARRQRVWFRRDPRIVWYGTSHEPAQLMQALLEDWSR